MIPNFFPGVQAFPEHRGEFSRPRDFSDSRTQNDNDIESHITAPRTSTVYGSNNVATLPPIKYGLSEARPTHSRRKFKVRLTEEGSLKLIHDIYETNEEIKSMWGSQSTLERSYLLNLRQTLCNMVTGVYMSVDDRVIQDVQNVICSALVLDSEEAISL